MIPTRRSLFSFLAGMFGGMVTRAEAKVIARTPSKDAAPSPPALSSPTRNGLKVQLHLAMAYAG